MINPEDALEKALYGEMERYIQENYDNPNRVGCPDHSFLKKAAFELMNLNSEEKTLFLSHVMKCAQCYGEVKGLKRSADGQ